MSVEKSAGAIIFRKEPFDAAQGKGGKIFYLLLHYPSGSRTEKPSNRVNLPQGRDYWDLPKGHIEKGETEAEAMRREVFEETGIKDLKLVPKFREVIKYFFKKKNKTIFKMVVFYLGETESEEIKISGEHTGYKWLPYKEALEQLSFKNAKEILKKANNLLSEKGLRGC